MKKLRKKLLYLLATIYLNLQPSFYFGETKVVNTCQQPPQVEEVQPEQLEEVHPEQPRLDQPQ